MLDLYQVRPHGDFGGDDHTCFVIANSTHEALELAHCSIAKEIGENPARKIAFTPVEVRTGDLDKCWTAWRVTESCHPRRNGKKVSGVIPWSKIDRTTWVER